MFHQVNSFEEMHPSPVQNLITIPTNRLTKPPRVTSLIAGFYVQIKGTAPVAKPGIAVTD
jgi:hypothetical protein